MKKNHLNITLLFGAIITGQLIAQDVNLFTGGLNYGVPLITVPSNRGNAIPIGLSYGGNGISVLQPASEVGLGWDLSAGGSITRVTGGIADDFVGNLFSQSTRTFSLQKGTLYGPTTRDVLTTTRNLDSLEFYFPNYDAYYVNGPGIGGSMSPMLLNYMSFSKDGTGGFSYNPTASGTYVKPQFTFQGDFSDTLVSRHYPSTPVGNSTPIKFPQDVISGDCHNDATPYFGKKGNGTGSNCEENYDPTTNRLATANYVEYFTNAEIDQIAYTNIPGFIDYKLTHTRPGSDFPPDGIGAFRITNSAGFVYHYSLPVYSNSTTNYNYPLNNDYSMPKYTCNFAQAPHAKTGTDDQYYVQHNVQYNFSDSTSCVIEYKETNKIAQEWKLTAITGPDYEDTNNNHIVDNSDKGYWVAFEYKLWANSFTKRYPTYGFSYAYDLDKETESLSLTDPLKYSGKSAVVSLNDVQAYYLNSIQTSSHKAIFVRDIRQDEISSNSGYDRGVQDTTHVRKEHKTVSSWHGVMWDDGYGYWDYPYEINPIKTVQLGKIEKLTLKFSVFNITSPAKLHIYAGQDTTAPEVTLSNYPSAYTGPFNSLNALPINTELTINNYTATAITFKTEGNLYPGEYQLEWHASSSKAIPELSVKRILLINADASLPSVNSATHTNTSFDFSTTTNTSSPLYNETWYQLNKAAINATVLKGVTMEYDYSLAKNYHKNINCSSARTTHLSSPGIVQTSLTTNTVTGGTGKLTLNKLVYTELGNVQIAPSTKFDYFASSPTDNPNFDPRKTDYWGYYKGDVSGLGYYGYTTFISKEHTDAWALRKMTSPLGGITEIEYESNTYNSVFKGNGEGMKGPSRIFPVASVSTNSLQLNLEEGTYFNADLWEVYGNFAPAGTTNDVLVSFNEGIAGSTRYFGAFTYSFNPLAPLPIKLSYVGNKIYPDVLYNNEISCVGNPSVNVNPGTYTGNGWVRFTLPVGYNVYGGGVRVKKIITRNEATDAYTTLYEYENGVALNEADRFVSPKIRYNRSWPCGVPEKLQAFGGDKFDLAPAIGYSKVNVKKLGQVNAAKGWTEFYFNTSDVYIDHYKANITSRKTYTVTGNSCQRTDTAFIVEYVDKYSPYWGLTTEQRMYDVNNNMLGKTVYDYETTGQGALVENFVFEIAKKKRPSANPDIGYPDPCVYNIDNLNASYEVCIKRHYPVILKRSTSYGMGTKTISETLRRDEVTGEATVVRTMGDNNTSALSFKTPAFRIAAFAGMGPKSVNPSWANVLGSEAYHYAIIDSTIANNNFAGAGASVYTRTAYVRGYDAGNNTYTTSLTSLPYWYNRLSYAWSGTVGSLDQYGLYKRSEITTYPFNFSSPSSNNTRWRLSSDISLMDDKGHTIETRLFNNKFTASKFDASGKYLLAQISNCNYKSFTFSGFESLNALGMSDGEINMSASYCALSNAVTPHSGNFVLRAYGGGGNSTMPRYSITYDGTGVNGEELGLLRGRVYRASVWTHTTSVSSASLYLQLNGSTPTGTIHQTVAMGKTDARAITIGEWTLLSVDIKVPADYQSAGSTINNLTAGLSVPSGTAYFDDFQLHPVESTTGAKVYDPLMGWILADISAEGYATKYTYDAAGRLVNTYQEIPNVGLKLIKRKTYNYARGTN